MIKSRGLKLAGRVARLVERRGEYRGLVGETWWRDNLEDLGVDGIVLKWIFRKWDGEAWTGLIWLRIGTGAGLLWTR